MAGQSGWRFGAVDISSDFFSLEWTAVRGGNVTADYRGDIGLDDVVIYSGASCQQLGFDVPEKSESLQ